MGDGMLGMDCHVPRYASSRGLGGGSPLVLPARGRSPPTESLSPPPTERRLLPAMERRSICGRKPLGEGPRRFELLLATDSRLEFAGFLEEGEGLLFLGEISVNGF